MLVNEFLILQECIERGVAYGRRRAYKHTDTPSADALEYAIIDAVTNDICEHFTFRDREDAPFIDFGALPDPDEAYRRERNGTEPEHDRGCGCSTCDRPFPLHPAETFRL